MVRLKNTTAKQISSAVENIFKTVFNMFYSKSSEK